MLTIFKKKNPAKENRRGSRLARGSGVEGNNDIDKELKAEDFGCRRGADSFCVGALLGEAPSKPGGNLGVPDHGIERILPVPPQAEYQRQTCKSYATSATLGPFGCLLDQARQRCVKSVDPTINTRFFSLIQGNFLFDEADMTEVDLPCFISWKAGINLLYNKIPNYSSTVRKRKPARPGGQAGLRQGAG